VRDINLDARSAAIRESKGGKPRHLALTDEGVALFRSLVAYVWRRTWKPIAGAIEAPRHASVMGRVA
jgi:hypothetical protein